MKICSIALMKALKENLKNKREVLSKLINGGESIPLFSTSSRKIMALFAKVLKKFNLTSLISLPILKLNHLQFLKCQDLQHYHQR